jgi:uncharacterized protein
VKHLLIPRNSAAELAAFEAVCLRMTGFDIAISYEWVDGFLTALAASPRVPEAEAWVPAMLGETFERVFADPEDQAYALGVLQTRLKLLCRQLDPEALFDDPETLRLEPLMVEWGDAEVRLAMTAPGLPADQHAMLQTGALWAHAFFAAQAAFPEPWEAPADEQTGELFKHALAKLGALFLPADSQELAAHISQYCPDTPQDGPPSRDDLIAEAMWSVQDMRMYWVDFAAVTPTIRVDHKPGRNEPCHCGSGKKFKKCHGA